MLSDHKYFYIVFKIFTLFYHSRNKLPQFFHVHVSPVLATMCHHHLQSTSPRLACLFLKTLKKRYTLYIYKVKMSYSTRPAADEHNICHTLKSKLKLEIKNSFYYHMLKETRTNGPVGYR